jgi:putative phosphoesterase
MTKICLLSDTHGHVDDRMLELAAESDEVWHAGDFGSDVTEKFSSSNVFRGVYGNIDGHILRSQFPEYSCFTIDKLSVLMIHIAGPFGSYTPQVRKLLEEYRPQLLVCGHSHILKVQHDQKRNVMYMNPGAAGKHGFHKVRTMLRFTISRDKLENLEAIELGMRGAIQ